MSCNFEPSQNEAQRALERHAQYGPRWPAIEDRVLAGVSASRDDAGARVRRGLQLADSGDLAGAIKEHEAALALDPSLALAHESLITLYDRVGDWSKAEAHYRALVALGRPREAIAEFEKIATPRDAESPRYVFGLAVAHLRAGDKAEGIKSAAEAKQLAAQHGQHDLAAAIERELASIK